MSTQFLIKDVVGIGGSYLSVVDQGWVEVSSGQGANVVVGRGASSFFPLNSNVPPLIMIMGAVTMFWVLRY